jgi:hypothetical protein
MTTTTETTTEPKDIIDIPMISNYDIFERNRDKANENGYEHCPCCGKTIKNPQFFFNSIYGGMAYPSNDKTEYNDAWVMGVGTECQKKFPKGYIFKQ